MRIGILKNRESGQVAPFLIIVIVILLIATMATVNVGKVGTARINTGNAADAGALAGASVLASAENAIAEANAGEGTFNTGFIQGTSLRNAYFEAVALFGIPLPLEAEGLKYAAYVSYSASLLYNYLNLLYVGYRGMQNAQAEAHQLVFNNLQIEEAEKVKQSDLTPLKSDFNKWIEAQDFKGDSFTYSWKQYSFSPEQGKQVQETEDNWVRSDVGKPSTNALLPIPMPAAPLINFYWKWIPPCTVDDCAACAAAAAQYWTKYAQINGAESLETKAKTEGTMQMSINGSTLTTTATAGSSASILITQLETTTGIPLVQAFTLSPPICGNVAWMTVVYWVPVPFIVGMLPDAEAVSIKVEATRYEPSSDLGLFQGHSAEVKSGAKAVTYGGNVFSPHSYKIRLEETW